MKIHIRRTKSILTEAHIGTYMYGVRTSESTTLIYAPSRSNWKIPILRSIIAKRSFASDKTKQLDCH
jgi:hypothetical protein